MESFDRENIDELLEIHQIVNIFPCQNFAPYGICIVQFIHDCNLFIVESFVD